MKQYRIRRVDADFEVDGALSKPVWNRAEPARVDQYPWRKPGDPEPPRVEARLLYSSQALYVRFHAVERHIVARHMEYQSSVCLDSCVEFFVSPGTAGYFNFEINCVGSLLLFDCKPVRQWTPVPWDRIKDIRIATSLPKGRAIPDPMPGPAEGYIVEYAIPLAFFLAQSGCRVPGPGTSWRANLYKCCDHGPEPAWGSWSPIGTAKPDFHCPEYFGELLFE